MLGDYLKRKVGVVNSDPQDGTDGIRGERSRGIRQVFTVQSASERRLMPRQARPTRARCARIETLAASRVAQRHVPVFLRLRFLRLATMACFLFVRHP